jgi:hypothetical protein
MIHRPTHAFLYAAPAMILAAAAPPALPAASLRYLNPERFEATRLFRDWHLKAKRELPQPLRRGQPQTRAYSYTFSPTEGFQDGLSVVLFQRQAVQNAAYETTHMIIYWKQEEDPKAVMAGRRRLQVHRILASLDLGGSEDQLVGTLSQVATRKDDHRAEVKVPAPHQVTAFRVQAHNALGFEIRTEGEQQ